MPHIHTQPNQHDMTVSAYIIRREAGTWKCLVHLHKKIDTLMQVGGHIELDTTPWQSMAAELREETGYTLRELTILQPYADLPSMTDPIVHPVPLLVNTHDVGKQHYHSDMCYGFVARAVPDHTVADGESHVLRWLTLGEMQQEADRGAALQDAVDIYRWIFTIVDDCHQVAAEQFSLEKPTKGITYKR